MEIQFENLENAVLTIDCIYKGGPNKDALPVLFPHCGFLGGFRKKCRNDDKKKLAYVILFTSLSKPEWPDYFDKKNGILKYYGDNEDPDKNITDTKPGGNKLLIKVFSMLNLEEMVKDIPPFFVFKKSGNGRDVQFLGLAAPGNPKIPPFDDIRVVKHEKNGKAFLNYEAYFTILDTRGDSISRKWLEMLIENHKNSLKFAPKAWKDFIKKGRNGIKALEASKIISIK